MMSKLEGKSPPPTRELWDPAALQKYRRRKTSTPTTSLLFSANTFELTDINTNELIKVTEVNKLWLKARPLVKDG